MKVEILETRGNERKYPWVGVLKSEGDTSVVVFSHQCTGICIHSTDEVNQETPFSDNWDEDQFTPCKVIMDSI